MTLSYVSEISAGGVIVRRAEGRFEVCLTLRTRYGKTWGLPKGHVETGEDPSTAAVREVREETGLVGDILQPLGTVAYQFRDRTRNVLCSKTVWFFLMRASGGRLDDHDAEAVEARWMPFDEARATITYPNERQVLERAQQLLTQPDVAIRITESS